MWPIWGTSVEHFVKWCPTPINERFISRLLQDAIRPGSVSNSLWLNMHIGRADLIEEDTEAAVENNAVESSKERKGVHVRGGRSCEETDAADVHIANDLIKRLLDGRAKAEETMRPSYSVKDPCGGQTSPACHVSADWGLKGDDVSDQSTPPESPFKQSHGAADFTSSSMSLSDSPSTPVRTHHKSQGNGIFGAESGSQASARRKADKKTNLG
ncbi:hypothetical protein LTR12_018057 [Friedmanniomyces endolithicus]|nr:hypothetical protein LTR12_018057 [Friedmanniomyces endolithicus]